MPNRHEVQVGECDRKRTEIGQRNAKAFEYRAERFQSRGFFLRDPQHGIAEQSIRPGGIRGGFANVLQERAVLAPVDFLQTLSVDGAHVAGPFWFAPFTAGGLPFFRGTPSGGSTEVFTFKGLKVAAALSVALVIGFQTMPPTRSAAARRAK